ncbi:hypothetical protein NF27_HS00320 [Candidatus Jidaibacter acanthamoeba]|uniref:Thioredoxin-like fold domain-containing protein n=2 Tax=Candidatus Jidaibacter acanthamoebae TaxID=86105 RepID=A0A0C1QWS6_9RICK|nr:hypothetical protein NF27_HS00320 [Candidatus Jidaibacter acanthamoeba]
MNMNYRILSTYVFLLGFFAFLGFAYFNYSKSPSVEKLNTEKFRENESALEETIIKVIKDNPEAIIKSLENYQMKKMQEAIAESGKKIKTHLAELENNSDDPRVGMKNAKVKVIEFFDYNCGYCKHTSNIKSKIIEQNPDIEYVFKELPILGESSVLAARYALAVNIVDKSKYLAFHLAVLNDKGKKDEEALLSLAGKVGVNIPNLKKALTDNKINEIIQANQNLARTVGIGGTPTFIIAGELMNELGYESLVAKINEAKAKAEQPNKVTPSTDSK